MKTMTIKKVAEFLGELLLRVLASIILIFVFIALYAVWDKITALAIYAIVSIAYITLYAKHEWRDGILSFIGIGILCVLFFTSLSTSLRSDIQLLCVGIFIYTLQFEISN